MGKFEVVTHPFRHYGNIRSKEMKERYVVERLKRTEFKLDQGEIYEKAAKQVDARDKFQRSNKIIKDQVPQHQRGKGVVLPSLRYPRLKETDLMKTHRISKQFVKRNGNAPFDNVHNVNETWNLVTREQMFDGLTHNNEGAHQYLQARYKHLPEKKYKNPVVSSWEYGWHVTPIMRNFPSSSYARGQIMRRSFLRNRGVTNPSDESAGLCVAMRSKHAPYQKITLLAHTSTFPLV